MRNRCGCLTVSGEGKNEGERKRQSCFWLSCLRPVKNDEGFVLIVALVMLVLLTFLGIAALTTTTTEILISGSDRSYKQAFYNADAGISYAVEAGVSMFPSGPVGTVTNLASQPADLPSDILLQYADQGTVTGVGRMVDVHSTGTSGGGATTTIIAGLIGTVAGQQPGSNPLGY